MKNQTEEEKAKARAEIRAIEYEKIRLEIETINKNYYLYRKCIKEYDELKMISIHILLFLDMKMIENENKLR